MPKKKFSIVALGGTFDHFHVGHQHLIQYANSLSKHLIIGITSANFSQQNKTNTHLIESFRLRYDQVKSFCQKNAITADLVEIDDPIGPAGIMKEIEALVYTSDLKNNADKINLQRKINKLKPLLLIEAPILLNKENMIVASKYIRAGLMSRNGDWYPAIFSKNITISDHQRLSLQNFPNQAFNLIQANCSNNFSSKIIVVGDATLEFFLSNHFSFSHAILDGKKERREYSPLVIERSEIQLIAQNPSGSLSSMGAKCFLVMLKQNLQYLYILGEEDLMAVIAALLAPLNSRIYFGLRKQGVVYWQVDEVLKTRIHQILS